MIFNLFGTPGGHTRKILFWDDFNIHVDCVRSNSIQFDNILEKSTYHSGDHILDFVITRRGNGLIQESLKSRQYISSKIINMKAIVKKCLGLRTV